MRRRVLRVLTALAMVVPGFVLAAPADASTVSLTVTGIAHDGTPATGQVEVWSRTSVALYIYDIGHTRRIPPGKYDVFVSLVSTRGSVTLGFRRLTLSNSTTLSFDGRAGDPLSVSLHPAPPAGYDQELSASVCDNTNPDDPLTLLNSAPGGQLFVIPSSLSTSAVAYGSEWRPADGDNGGSIFLASGIHRGGIPAGLRARVDVSSLAAVHVTARSGAETGSQLIDFYKQDQDICRSGTETLLAQPDLPATLTAYVPAGSYDLNTTATDYASGHGGPYQAGHSYSLQLNRAVTGPGGGLPYVAGRDLVIGSTAMFADPTLPGDTNATITERLTRGSTVLASRSAVPADDATVARAISTAGWYTLTMSATRRPINPLPAGTLSTRSTLLLHFWAAPSASNTDEEQVRAYLARFSPGPLDITDHARSGARTTVIVTPQRLRTDDPSIRQPSDSVASVLVSVSRDDGKTWHAATVRHAGGVWSVIVPDTGHGSVSLRSKIVDVHGDSSVTTVIRAYAIG